MNVDPGLQLDLIGALQRRLAMIVTVVGSTLLIAYWIAMALPNYYRSSATIFVEPQAINQKLVESGVGVYDIGYRLSLMTAQILSRPRLSRVIDEFELYQDESETMLREEIINLMRLRITVAPAETGIVQQASKNRDTPELNTFIVAFTHKSPQIAAAVAQKLANDFLKEHIESRVGMTRKSLEFIETEVYRLDAELRVVRDQITQVKDDNPGRLPEDQASNQRLLDRTLTELREGHRVLDAARSNKSFWDTQLLSAAAMADPRDDASPMRRLQILELRLAEHRSRGFTDRHPDVIGTKQEIVEVRAQIVSRVDDGDERAPSMAQQNASAHRERAALEVEMAMKEVDRVRENADLYERRLLESPKVAELLGGLDQQAMQLSENVRQFAQRRLQASVQVNVERRQLGEQFRILEAAFPAPTPSSPNRLLIIVMGLIAGLALGVGSAVLAEAADSSFRMVRDVQSTLSIPVLAAIPEIILESDRALRRRIALRNMLAASLVVVVCLAGGAVTYMYVNGVPGWLSAVIEGEEVGDEPGDEAGFRPRLDTLG